MKKPRKPLSGPDSADDYTVGPGRPPREHQFKPGQSGNPKGRPKRAGPSRKAISQMVEVELHKPVVVTQGRRRESMPTLQVGIAQLSTQAAKGDRHALRDLVMIAKMAGLDFSPQPDADSNDEISPNRQALLDDYLARHGAIRAASVEDRVIAPPDLLDDDVDPDEEPSS